MERGAAPNNACFRPADLAGPCLLVLLRERGHSIRVGGELDAPVRELAARGELACRPVAGAADLIELSLTPAGAARADFLRSALGAVRGPAVAASGMRASRRGERRLPPGLY